MWEGPKMLTDKGHYGNNDLSPKHLGRVEPYPAAVVCTVYIGQDSKWINFDSTFGRIEPYLVYRGDGFVTEISSCKSCLHAPKIKTVYDPCFLSIHRMVNFHHDCWTPSRFQRDLPLFGAQDIIILKISKYAQSRENNEPPVSIFNFYSFKPWN